MDVAMPTSLPFDAAWRDLGRRSTMLWLLLLGCVPGMFLFAYFLNDLLLQDAPFFVVAVVWMVPIAWAGSRMASFLCPRCGGVFFENWYFFKPLRRSCAHCNLLRWAKDLPPVTSG